MVGRKRKIGRLKKKSERKFRKRVHQRKMSKNRVSQRMMCMQTTQIISSTWKRTVWVSTQQFYWRKCHKFGYFWQSNKSHTWHGTRSASGINRISGSTSKAYQHTDLCRNKESWGRLRQRQRQASHKVNYDLTQVSGGSWKDGGGLFGDDCVCWLLDFWCYCWIDVGETTDKIMLLKN